MGAYADRPARRAAGRPPENAGALRRAVGLRGAAAHRADRARDGRRRRTAASSTCSDRLGRQLPRDAARPGVRAARRSAGCRCASTSGHRAVQPDARRVRAATVLLLPAPTRYEQAGGGHRDHDRAPRHLQPGDRRAARRRGAAGVAGLRASWRAPRPARAAPSGSRFDGTAAIRAEIARAVPFYDGIADAARRRRLVPVRRRAPVRGRALPDRRRPRRTSPVARCRTSIARRRHVRVSHAARQAVQQHGPRAARRAHRRGPRRGADEPDDADRLGLADGDRGGC